MGMAEIDRDKKHEINGQAEGLRFHQTEPRDQQDNSINYRLASPCLDWSRRPAIRL
jgi:hypothetical protein